MCLTYSDSVKNRFGMKASGGLYDRRHVQDSMGV